MSTIRKSTKSMFTAALLLFVVILSYSHTNAQVYEGMYTPSTSSGQAPSTSSKLKSTELSTVNKLSLRVYCKLSTFPFFWMDTGTCNQKLGIKTPPTDTQIINNNIDTLVKQFNGLTKYVAGLTPTSGEINKSGVVSGNLNLIKIITTHHLVLGGLL